MKSFAKLENNLLTLSTGVARYEAKWNDGHLIGTLLEDGADHRWELTGAAPDCGFPGQPDAPSNGRLAVADIAATPMIPAHVRVEVETRMEAGRLRVSA